MSRHSMLLMAAAAALLAGCASSPRQGPPAPVVQVTPRAPEALPAARPEPPATPAPAPNPTPRATQVYAYQDPSAAPERTETVHESQIQPPPDAEVTEPVDPTPPGITPALPAPPPPPAKPAVAPPPVAPAPKPAAPATAAPPTTAAPAPKPAATAVTAAKPATPTPPATSPKPATTAPPPKPAATPAKPPARPVESAPPPLPAPSRAPAPPPPAPPQQVAKAQPPAPRAPALAPPSLPAAAEALARQADQQRQAGDYAGAAASLERSLRIAPREAYLWNRLARVRLEQGQTSQANNMAARANDLAGDNPNLKKDNWQVIAEARRRAGDAAGASEAEKRAGQ